MITDVSGAAETPKTNVRAMFPGYYPPSIDELKRFVTEGLVVLDTNALLDVYRFTEKARSEYLQTLGLLGARLWLPNRAAQELHERRTTVIRSRRTERLEFDQNLNAAAEELVSIIARYANRRGLRTDDIREITKLVEFSRQKVQEKLDELACSDDSIDPDCHPDADPVLQRIVELINGKVGKPLSEKEQASRQKDWLIRLAAKIPPGFEDAKKGDRAIGDYLVWHQTLQEAKRRHNMPVLMISNDQKQDWVRRDGSYSGPRPELVKEMLDHAGQPFHLVDVYAFLTLANNYLSAQISEATVDEASRLGDEPDPRDAKRAMVVSRRITIEHRLAELYQRERMASLRADRAHAEYAALRDHAGPLRAVRDREQLQHASQVLHAARTERAHVHAQIAQLQEDLHEVELLFPDESAL
jgi:hypothetical protein